jgi:hypothetical protein
MTSPTQNDTPPPIRTLDADASPCRCVKTHSPAINRTHVHHVWPLGMGGPDISSNEIALCPNTHDFVHLIMQDFRRFNAVRPRRRSETRYAYDLAVRGFTMYLNNREVVGTVDTSDQT